ncbi:MAG: helix-turn-helix domain-containing protein, partial [Betaproteobacteria bacterium]
MGARDPKPAGKAGTDSGRDAVFLARLGERIRDARMRQGLSRRALAGGSGVSERYLAELEAGRGNI